MGRLSGMKNGLDPFSLGIEAIRFSLSRLDRSRCINASAAKTSRVDSRVFQRMVYQTFRKVILLLAGSRQHDPFNKATFLQMMLQRETYRL